MVASILGTDINTGELVALEQDKRLGGMYVIGKTGSGKTTLLINLILQDIEQGMGLCFFDTHGDAITDILARLPSHREQDVILLDLLDNDYAFGLNLFHCKNPQDKQEVSRVTSMVMGVFAKLFTESGDLLKDQPYMAETLQNVVPVLLPHHSPRMTMAEIPLLLMDETARNKLLAPLTNPMVHNFWISYNRWRPDRQEEVTSSTRRRVGNFLTDSLILEIVGQSETTLDFRKIIDTRKILLVKLSRQHELITSLVGSVIVGQIANAAFSRSDTPEHQRVQFNLYADEYQRFSTPTFAELLAEVRKFRIATCVAHQWRGQLDEDNRGATLNAANMVVYQVSGEDADELAGQFNITPQAAWEEEIEKEWHERVEEVIDDGVEEIKTVVNNPFDWLVSGHTHISPVVNKYMDGTLRKIHAFLENDAVKEKYDTKTIRAEINSLLYEAMTSPNPLSVLSKRSSITILLHVNTCYPLGYDFFYYAFADKEDFDPSPSFPRSSYNYLKSFGTSLSTFRYRTSHIRMSNQGIMISRDDLFKITLTPTALEQIDDRVISAYAALLQSRGENQFNMAAATFAKLAQEVLSRKMEQYILEKVDQSTQLLSRENKADGLAFYMSHRQAFETFIREFRDFVLALAKDPPETSSGLTKPRKRTQIHYLTHPRKTITHPQRTYADLKSELATRLTNPPREYSAYCKLGTREYTIQALPFRPADAPSIVQARRERIIQRTRDLYCKRREEIEQEISKRQAVLLKPEPRKPRAKQEEDEE